MKKFFTRKIILTLLAIGIIVGAWTTWVVFFKAHKDYGNVKPAFTLSSEQLLQEFKSNTQAATAKYIDKPVLIDGAISEIADYTINFSSIACTVDSSQSSKLGTIKVGDKIKVQGQVVGYNDLMEEVTLSKCVFK